MSGWGMQEVPDIPEGILQWMQTEIRSFGSSGKQLRQIRSETLHFCTPTRRLFPLYSLSLIIKYALCYMTLMFLFLSVCSFSFRNWKIMWDLPSSTFYYFFKFIYVISFCSFCVLYVHDACVYIRKIMWDHSLLPLLWWDSEVQK